MSTLNSEGPFFDDLRHGDVFDEAPGFTLTDGAAAAHRSIVGDRLRLSLDAHLSRAVTGYSTQLAPPALVWNVAIGQSTLVTHHVKANLFYRGLYFRRFPTIGDTLYTRTEVVGLRQNQYRPGREPTGLVVLRISTVDQLDRVVLDFWRCAMLPLSGGELEVQYADDVSEVGSAYLPDDLWAPTAQWQLKSFRESYPHGATTTPRVGDTWMVVGGDVVSSAPELARLTLNIARTHHDNFSGPRLVYGGHTIAIALSQAVRVLPSLITVLGWHGCDHLGPVFEGDTLSSGVTIERIEDGGPSGKVADLRSEVWAIAADEGSEKRKVLDWRFVGLLP